MELAKIAGRLSHIAESDMINKIANTGGDRAGSVFRLYMGGNALVSWFVAMTEPRSMIRLAASSSEGTILSWALMLIGLAVVFDVLINDFLPDRFHWKTALRQRHILLAAMAFCYVAQLYVGFYSLHSPGLLLYYMWNACTIMFISFVDAHQRSKDATCVISCT